MNIVLFLLKDGTYVVGQSEIMEYEPRVHLTNPFSLSGKTKVALTRWPLYTNETDILLNSDAVLTDCSATQDIVDAYLKKIGKTLKDLNPEPRPVILNEDTILDDEEYEPRYTET